MGTVGPGSIHLLNGLYDAKKSRTPLLAICGQVPLAEISSDFFQEIDNDALFAGKPRSVRSGREGDGERGAEAEAALHVGGGAHRIGELLDDREAEARSRAPVGALA